MRPTQPPPLLEGNPYLPGGEVGSNPSFLKGLSALPAAEIWHGNFPAHPGFGSCANPRRRFLIH